MEIMSVGGVDIFVLPDCARCKLSNENPMDMIQCPEGRDVCYPDDCLNYDEPLEDELDGNSLL